MAYKVLYKASVESDLRKLDKTDTRRIVDKLEKDLGNDPNKGIPLKGSYQGLFRYRIGEFRIIYAKSRDGILVLRIGYRKDIYKK